MAERVLCFNVLLDESRRDVGVFRHPLYAYDEAMAWPPANWRQICCWHCCHPSGDSEPVPLPQAHDRKSDIFAVFGVFCSWPCAKQYQNEHQIWTSGERSLLLEEMAREAFGYRGPAIQAAPSRHRLIMFGGDLSLEQFRGEHLFANATLRPPLISFPEIYERCASSHGTEGNTAPPQWSVRGLRPNGTTSAAASSSSANLSPYDQYMLTRKSNTPKTAKRTAVTDNPDTLQRFLKKQVNG
jgi:hypothetical protein